LAGSAPTCAPTWRAIFFLNIFDVQFFVLDKMEVSIAGTIKTNHGGHKMNKCSKCGKDSEARRLADGLCVGCQKIKAKTLTDVPNSNFLNARALMQLPQK
jgi:hypothetical protein